MCVCMCDASVCVYGSCVGGDVCVWLIPFCVCVGGDVWVCMCGCGRYVCVSGVWRGDVCVSVYGADVRV